jgi:hypothetical protein
MNPSTDPYAVWLCTDTGRVLVTFSDEYLAMQFAVRHSTQVIVNPIDH